MTAMTAAPIPPAPPTQEEIDTAIRRMTVTPALLAARPAVRYAVEIETGREHWETVLSSTTTVHADDQRVLDAFVDALAVEYRRSGTRIRVSAATGTLVSHKTTAENTARTRH